MVTGYEADFYRQFGDLVKTFHQIVQALENLRKQLEENNKVVDRGKWEK